MTGAANDGVRKSLASSSRKPYPGNLNQRVVFVIIESSRLDGSQDSLVTHLGTPCLKLRTIL